MFDLIIIGAGPAGLTAGIYGRRANLNTLILESNMEGGQLSQTLEIANYPGVIEGETGMDLALKMKNQAERFGVEIAREEVKQITVDGKIKIVKTEKNIYETKTIILATGTKPRKLGIAGEDKFAGKGLSYCATCDGYFYQDGDIYVVGGGDSAVEESIFLTRFAKKVHIVHRRDTFRANAYLVERAKQNEKIEMIMDTELREIMGENKIEGIVLENNKTGEKTTIHREEGVPFGLFFYVGNDPQTAFLGDFVENAGGYIATDDRQETSIAGIYAAGDIIQKKIRQVVNATAEGAVAAMSASEYIEEWDNL